MARAEDAGNVPLVGGDLAVDFVNTVAGDRRGLAVDHLRSYDDLVTWAVHADTIPVSWARTLRRAAAAHPALAARTLARAVALREAIHEVLLSIVERRATPPDALAVVSAEAADAAARLRLERSGRAFEYVWDATPDPAAVLHKVARSAGRLLTEGRLDRLKVCAGDDCGWLFVDTSKAGRRRWCDMADCGSRDKARRYYRRQRAEA
jgi:predicted RNA-binding Zn ribbon-like protein